jgi:hypothetical protein
MLTFVRQEKAHPGLFFFTLYKTPNPGAAASPRRDSLKRSKSFISKRHRCHDMGCFMSFTPTCPPLEDLPICIWE